MDRHEKQDALVTKTGQTAAMDFEAGDGRVWSWAASPAEAEARRREADELVGQRIRQIHYYTLDYGHDQRHSQPAGPGPRLIGAEAEAEWIAPPWLYDGFDALDYGIEIVTESGATFFLTWDHPEQGEGIGLQPVAMLGSGTDADVDAGVAVWDVGARAVSWAPVVGRKLTGVELHYVPCGEEPGSLWCPHIAFHSEAGLVEVILGDSSEQDALVPSSDHVAVLHPGTPLPEWFRRHD
jgi:hypothetical protein